MQLGNKSTRNELNSNWSEILRIKWNHWESLLNLNREWLRPFIIQDMSYDYKKNDKYRQKQKICAKNYARKRCPPNQLNIKLITKNNKNLRLHFLQVTTIVVWKENKNLQKWGKYTKITKIGFHENWLFHEERPFEENKTLMKSTLYFNI